MIGFTPLDSDDTILPVGGAAAQSTPVDPASSTTPTLMDHDDEVIPVSTPTPTYTTQDQIDDHLRKMIDDHAVTGQQIRDFYTSLGGKLSEHDSAVLDARDQFNKSHHQPMAVGIGAPSGDGGAPGLVDNRPYSWWQGAADGAQNVLSNVAGGAGWAANKIGITNGWGDDAREHFANLDARHSDQGSANGVLAGEMATAAPAALVAAPVEAGATAIGIPAAGAVGAGMFADGALQGALTTNARTPGGVAKSAAVGGGLGLGFGAASRALSTLASAPTAAAIKGRQVLDAASQIGVHPLPADVGGSLVKGVNAAGEAGLLSNVPISAGVEHYLDSLQAARDQAAASFLPANVAPKSLDSAAVNVLHGVGGLGDYEARSAEAAGKLYDNAAALTGGAQIQTPRTLATVNALIEQANRTPGRTAGLDHLIALRDDLTPTADQTVTPSIFEREFGGSSTPTVIPGNRAMFVIDNLRRLRTSFGDNIDANQRAAREAANTLWGPLSDDIQDGLRSQGLDDAADAYKAADQAWAKRQQNMDEIVNPILSNRSHELLADKLTDLSRNDSDLLSRGLDLMAPDQSAHVKAALIGELGKANPSLQNTTNDAFSIAKYGTDWSKLSDGVKDNLLSGDAGTKLQALARLSEAAKDAGRYRNTSGTARSLDALNLLRTGVSGIVGGAGELAGGLTTAGGTLAAQYGLGHLLASPTVARGIVKIGEVRPFAKSGAALSILGRRTAPIIANGTPDNP